MVCGRGLCVSGGVHGQVEAIATLDSSDVKMLSMGWLPFFGRPRGRFQGGAGLRTQPGTGTVRPSCAFWGFRRTPAPFNGLPGLVSGFSPPAGP